MVWEGLSPFPAGTSFWSWAEGLTPALTGLVIYFHLCCGTGGPGCDYLPSARHPKVMAHQSETSLVSLSAEVETSASPGEGRDGRDINTQPPPLSTC